MLWESAGVRNDPELLSTSAAARAVGVDRSTLWRWIKHGYIQPHTRTAGGHLRWNPQRLQDEITALRTTPSQDPPREPRGTAEPPPQAAPIVAAVITSGLGVLVGRRHDGVPPWTFIAGEVETGESARDAAVREVLEETTLAVRAGGEEIGRRIHPATGRTMIYLACTPTAGTDVRIGDPEELAELRWIPTLAALFQLIPSTHMFPPVREHLARLLS
ncbi:MAG: NUDIX domain-containing protein [Actinomycetes bacterium]